MSKQEKAIYLKPRRNKMRKNNLISVMLIIAIIVSTVSVTPLNGFAAENSIKISINDELIEFNNTSGYPFADSNSRILVPFRVTLEKFGATVSWNQDTKTAIAEKDGIKVEIPLGAKYILKNGERIENDTEAVSKDGKTYLPIRKVMEAFGATVGWNSFNSTVTIVSAKPVIVPSQELTELINELKNQIIFENDIRTFTIYAFMNYTGYDDENNKSGFHEVRKMVRDDLDALKLDLIDNNFYTNHGKDYVYYKNSLKKLGAAPDFTPIGSLGKYEIQGIDKYLKEFYVKANIEELYKKYKPYYDRELAKYSYNVYESIAKTNNFLRVDTPHSDGFYVEVNLLDAYYRGFGLGNIDLYKGKGVILIGPSNEPNILNITHEYLHGIINPIIDNLDNEVNRLSNNMQYVQQSKAVSQGYDNWDEIVKESFVRALSRKMVSGNSIESARTETKDGFILTEYIYSRFDEYNNYEGSLEKFVSKILTEYNK
jgi:hypothetical protein